MSPTELQELRASLPDGHVLAGRAVQPRSRDTRALWEGDSVCPGSVGQTPLCTLRSGAETAFSNATSILQTNLLSLEGPTENDSHLGEFAGKWPSTADI